MGRKGYIDTRLPFGLRSASIIFMAVADALERCIRAQGVKYICHYLDDFITVGSPGSMECAANLAVTLSTCARLGVPIAADKSEHPSSNMLCRPCLYSLHPLHQPKCPV